MGGRWEIRHNGGSWHPWELIDENGHQILCAATKTAAIDQALQLAQERTELLRSLNTAILAAAGSVPIVKRLLALEQRRLELKKTDLSRLASDVMREEKDVETQQRNLMHVLLGAIDDAKDLH